MIWAFLSRFQDILSFIGFGTVMYWAVKLTAKITRLHRDRVVTTKGD